MFVCFVIKFSQQILECHWECLIWSRHTHTPGDCHSFGCWIASPFCNCGFRDARNAKHSKFSRFFAFSLRSRLSRRQICNGKFESEAFGKNKPDSMCAGWKSFLFSIENKHRRSAHWLQHALHGWTSFWLNLSWMCVGRCTVTLSLLVTGFDGQKREFRSSFSSFLVCPKWLLGDSVII